MSVAAARAAAYDTSNIFAKILRGEIPCHKIFETPKALAILDAFPSAEGHALLLPKFPAATVFDLPAEEAAEVLGSFLDSPGW